MRSVASANDPRRRVLETPGRRRWTFALKPGEQLGWGPGGRAARCGAGMNAVPAITRPKAITRPTIASAPIPIGVAEHENATQDRGEVRGKRGAVLGQRRDDLVAPILGLG